MPTDEELTTYNNSEIKIGRSQPDAVTGFVSDTFPNSK